MDKREMVIEAIKKLITLGVSDQEIIDNLYDVGIEKPDAMELISQAKSLVGAQGSGSQQKASPSVEIKTPGSVSQPKPVQGTQSVPASVAEQKPSSSKDFFEDTVDQLSMNDQIVQQLDLNKSSSSASQGSAAVSPGSKESEVSDDIAEKIMADVASQTGQKLEDKEEEKTNDAETKEPVPASMDNVVSAGEKKASVETKVLPSGLKVQEKSKSVPIEKEKSKSVLPEKEKSKPSPVLVEKEKNKSSPVPQSIPEKSPFVQSLQSASLPQNSKPVAPIPSINFTVPQNPLPASAEMSPDFEELWKKGIVVAVNAKLAEMKKLKDDVDAVVQEKVDEAVRKELYQYKVLMDSQKELIISSNKDALEQKQKEIVFIIDAKIAELRQFNKQLGDNLAVLEQSKKQQEIALQQITQALEDAKKTKSQLIVEMNSELIKAKSQAQAFLDSANTHLVQMDERVNKTLELEKNIADGMLQEAQQKIENLAIQRADELIANLEVELNRLQSISKNLSPETLEQKIQVLEEFRKQFLNNMQQSLVQINTAIEELNQKNILADRALQEKTLAIDAKLEELTKFEKEFTQKMDYLLSKK
jgi:hypothetical protein